MIKAGTPLSCLGLLTDGEGAKKQTKIFLGSGKCYKEKQTGGCDRVTQGGGGVMQVGSQRWFFEEVASELNHEWKKRTSCARGVKAPRRGWAGEKQGTQRTLGICVVTKGNGARRKWLRDDQGPGEKLDLTLKAMQNHWKVLTRGVALSDLYFQKLPLNKSIKAKKDAGRPVKDHFWGSRQKRMMMAWASSVNGILSW